MKTTDEGRDTVPCWVESTGRPWQGGNGEFITVGTQAKAAGMEKLRGETMTKRLSVWKPTECQRAERAKTLKWVIGQMVWSLYKQCWGKRWLLLGCGGVQLDFRSSGLSEMQFWRPVITEFRGITEAGKRDGKEREIRHKRLGREQPPGWTDALGGFQVFEEDHETLMKIITWADWSKGKPGMELDKEPWAWDSKWTVENMLGGSIMQWWRPQLLPTLNLFWDPDSTASWAWDLGHIKLSSCATASFSRKYQWKQCCDVPCWGLSLHQWHMQHREEGEEGKWSFRVEDLEDGTAVSDGGGRVG